VETLRLRSDAPAGSIALAAVRSNARLGIGLNSREN
jgi:hypothetical protein